MLYPFLLTFIAGFSTMLGTLPIFVKIKNKNDFISMSCSFAAGVMISMSIFDLIPEGIKYLSYFNNSFLIILICFLAIMFGIIESMFMENLVFKYSDGNNLFKIGILSMLVIMLHNIPEGIITYMVSNKDIVLGISICVAIALHNIPEGISIAVPIFLSTGSKFKALKYTFISSLSEVFGALITYLFLLRYVSNLLLGILFCFIAGIMIQISYNKLLPTSLKNNTYKGYIFFMIGFIFILISLLINNLIS